jgi:hypothetical protein
MTEKRGHSVPTAREACKHLRLPVIDDAIESLNMLTVLSTLGPHRLDAGRYIVASRFRCRSFDRRYVVGELSTGRCLPAVAPRVLVMGDEVRTRSSSPDNHFAPLFKSQPLAQPNKAIGLESHIGSWLACYLEPIVPCLRSFTSRRASNHHRDMKPRRQNPQLAGVMLKKYATSLQPRSLRDRAGCKASSLPPQGGAGEIFFLTSPLIGCLGSTDDGQELFRSRPVVQRDVNWCRHFCT